MNPILFKFYGTFWHQVGNAIHFMPKKMSEP